MRRPYYLDRRGKVWYWKPSDDSAGWKSTRKTTKGQAIAEVTALLGEQASRYGEGSDVRFGDYAQPFYLWTDPNGLPECPRCRDRKKRGLRIGPEHAARQRRLLEAYILKDAVLCKLALRRIIPQDIADFGGRLERLLKIGETDQHKRTYNAILAALGGILSYAERMGKIARNPVREMSYSYRPIARDTFTPDELRTLFPRAVDKPGPWGNLRDKTAFFLAGSLGLRRSEIRALHWQDIDLERGRLTVAQSFKGRRLGLPKGGKPREAQLSPMARLHLAALKRNATGEYVFASKDGGSLGTQWWKLAWRRALAASKISVGNRLLVPHSLRHTAATELAKAGVSAAELQTGFGWATERMAKHYTDHEGLKDIQLERQANIIDKIFTA